MTAPQTDPVDQGVTPESPPQPRLLPSLSTRYVSFLTHAVGVIVLVVWTALGLFLYIPLLIRGVALYSVALAAASMGRGRIEMAQLALEKQIAFLPNGYHLALRIIRQPHPTTTGEIAPTPGDVRRLLLETAIAMAFWLITWLTAWALTALA